MTFGFIGVPEWVRSHIGKPYEEHAQGCHLVASSFSK
jgi:hypothetical protein